MSDTPRTDEQIGIYVPTSLARELELELATWRRRSNASEQDAKFSRIERDLIKTELEALKEEHDQTETRAIAHGYALNELRARCGLVRESPDYSEIADLVDELKSERDQLKANVNRLLIERDQLQAERDHVLPPRPL